MLFNTGSKIGNTQTISGSDPGLFCGVLRYILKQKNLNYNSLQFFFILINLKKYNYLQTKFQN